MMNNMMPTSRATLLWPICGFYATEAIARSSFSKDLAVRSSSFTKRPIYSKFPLKTFKNHVTRMSSIRETLGIQIHCSNSIFSAFSVY
jgi:hypothetical protein